MGKYDLDTIKELILIQISNDYQSHPIAPLIEIDSILIYDDINLLIGFTTHIKSTYQHKINNRVTLIPHVEYKQNIREKRLKKIKNGRV